MGLDRAGLGACWSQFFHAARALARSPVPVVAAIAGHNPAGGCVLALCCDYRVMARGPFRIGLNETQVGLTVPDAIQYLMRRVVGAHRAERLIVAGAMVESEQAHALGMVDALTDAGEVVDAAPRTGSTNCWRCRHRRCWRPAGSRGPTSSMRWTHSPTPNLNRFLDGWYSDDSQVALKALLARLKK